MKTKKQPISRKRKPVVGVKHNGDVHFFEFPNSKQARLFCQDILKRWPNTEYIMATEGLSRNNKKKEKLK